jgi:L-galactose dehydrogenase
MDYVILGKTGLASSVIGLGCGGHSRIGQGTGKTEKESVELVSQALSLGVNFFDTSEVYGTEEILGKALAGASRRDLIISTKIPSFEGDAPLEPAKMAERLDKSLARLGTDYVDVYHLHGVRPQQYPHAARSLVPKLEKLKTSGKIRFMGITEAFESDCGHAMLEQAMRDGCWDVVMVGFNILNQCARERVLARARELDTGVLCMFALRRALSRHERLKEVIADLKARGKLGPGLSGPGSPLEFLERPDAAESLQDAAYRFCRYEPGVHVVLSGTGNPAHLAANVRSLNRPPLPPVDLERLRSAFAAVDDVSGA